MKYIHQCTYEDCADYIDYDTNDYLCIKHYRFKCWDLYLLQEELEAYNGQ